MAEWLALSTSDHGVSGSNAAGGKLHCTEPFMFTLPSSRND